MKKPSLPRGNGMDRRDKPDDDEGVAGASLKETRQLLASPANAARLAASIAELDVLAVKPDPKLHHVCKKIVPGSTEKVIELLSLLGCEVTYREPAHGWFMVGQKGLPFDIQLIEKPTAPQTGQFKVNSHVAFISEDPGALIDKVESWANKNHLAFKRGGWSDRELWFDLPDLFVDFVIEVMHASITEG
jgi:hypothetical protein